MTFRGSHQDDWHTITPTAPYTAGTPAPAYMVNGEGTVFLRGQIVRNAAASGATAFTLPTDYRPTEAVRLPLIVLPDATSTGRIAVSTAGVVGLHERTGTVTSYYLDCSFTTL